MGLIGSTALVTSLGIELPELYMGIANMGIGGASLSLVPFTFTRIRQEKK